MGIKKKNRMSNLFFDRILRSKYYKYTIIVINIVAIVYVFFSVFYGDISKSHELKKEMRSVIAEVAQNSIANYIDTINYIEHKQYLSIEDSVMRYIENLDRFNNYEIGNVEDKNAILIACKEFYSQVLDISRSKSNLLSAILVNQVNQQADSLRIEIETSFVNKASLLMFKYEDFNKKRIANEKKLRFNLGKLIEDNNDIQGVKNCLKEDYSLYHSREFNEIELCFLDIVSEYLQMVKKSLKQEQE